jgi:hypothetical protein
MKTVLIKQSKGLGDIFFCQKIANKLVERGHRVIWPVISKYLYIKNYLIGSVEYVDVDGDFDYKSTYTACGKGEILEQDCIVLSTDGCRELDKVSGVMLSKYNLAGVSHEDWLAYFNFNRNLNREDDLFKLLKLDKDEKYVVVNRQIGGPGDESSWRFEIPSTLRQVEIKEYPTFTIFDWSKVLENATSFYTMETCISYIIEKLNTNETDYIMYHRSPSTSSNCKEFLSIYKKPRKHIGCESIIRI